MHACTRYGSVRSRSQHFYWTLNQADVALPREVCRPRSPRKQDCSWTRCCCLIWRFPFWKFSSRSSFACVYHSIAFARKNRLVVKMFSQQFANECGWGEVRWCNSILAITKSLQNKKHIQLNWTGLELSAPQISSSLISLQEPSRRLSLSPSNKAPNLAYLQTLQTLLAPWLACTKWLNAMLKQTLA